MSMLAQLLFPHAWVCDSTVDVADSLPPSEQPAIASAVPSRVAEFTTGRWCAREALAAAGLPGVELPRSSTGAPVWPSGIVGSITHCHRYRAAAIARTHRWSAIGIDAEPTQRLPEGVCETITSSAERRHIDALTRWCDLPLDRLIFSAKESIYKAWSTLTSTWLDFTDAEVRLAVDGTFTARLHLADPRCNQTISGRWGATQRLLVTTVVIPPL